MSLIRRASNGAPQKTVDLIGFPRLYRPGEIEGAIQQGDQQVEILNDELVEADFGAPTTGHLLVLDGRQLTVQGARPVYEGAALIGHSIWVRG
ncbi:hypothetical protein [Roseomonas xinghualingensis]|uniref:hypothetical protein n=1 Tax=Roseomonas xinghualingensis TaxID=2986475 RepID=UPI0021F1E480|nr:hypothetical protein [Roseomonas sp. SXEYE001]MCV4209894.1 hypothetical protein [Roseomonas sp. SXEYE001]